MTSDTFGLTSLSPLMRFDLDSASWRTCADTCLWDLEMSSPTFPEWGTMRAGVLYALPTPERPTVAQESSSLRNVPTRDYKDTALSFRVKDGRSHEELPDVIAGLCLPKMLPTPQAADGSKMSSNPETSARRRMKGNQETLTDIVQTEMLPKGQAHWLLPTPAVNDMGAGKDPEAWNEWSARQKSADGRSAPHGKSLWQEALLLLPTPTTMDASFQEIKIASHRPNDKDSMARALAHLLPTPRAQARDVIYEREDYHHNLEEALALLPRQTGESTLLQSDDGKLF